MKTENLNKISAGYSEDNFYVAFHCDVNDEKAEIEMSVDEYKNFISALFKVGREYQKHFNKDIGFGREGK